MNINIVNAIDSNQYEEFMNSKKGEETFRDAISGNRDEIEQVLDGCSKYDPSTAYEGIPSETLSKLGIDQLDEIISHGKEMIISMQAMLDHSYQVQHEAFIRREAILKQRRCMNALGDMCRQTYCGYVRRNKNE